MQFPLKPWDRNRPRLHPPLADCVASHGGKTFGLRARNGILFFRDADDTAKTWAIALPLPPGLEEDKAGLETFWRREFGRGNIARYLVHLDSYVDRTIPLFFKGDGTGWAREAWNRDDLPFHHAVSMHVLLEGKDEKLTEDLGEVERQLEAQMSQLDWPDDSKWEDDEGEIEWLCGSRDELEQVLGWACALEASFWGAGAARIELNVATENPFARARIAEMNDGQSGENGGLWFEADPQSDALSLGYGSDSFAPSHRFWTLCDLALDQNTPMGLYWEYHDYGMGRCADAPNSMWIPMKFERPNAAQIETARRELQAWLGGKVPAGEIETILGDDAPGELPKHKW